MCLAESCIAGGIGFVGSFTAPERWDAALFGEAQSRIVVSLSSEALTAFESLASEEGVPWVHLGEVGGDSLSLPSLMDLPVTDLRAAWEGGLEEALG